MVAILWIVNSRLRKFNSIFLAISGNLEFHSTPIMSGIEVHPEQKPFNRKLKLSIQQNTEGDISRTQSISSSINLNENGNLKKLKKKAKSFSIHLAPLNTPMESRLQTLGIIWHTVSIPVFILLFLFTLC